MARFGSLDTQYFNDAGDPLVNGKIYFYESGTTTLKNTYADRRMVPRREGAAGGAADR